MPDVTSPIAVCVTAGLGATCAQVIATAVWPDFASYGVTWPSLVWGVAGGYAGEMLRRMKADEDGKPHRKATALFIALSAALGALGGNWLAKTWLGGSVEAVAGASVLIAATWQWLILAWLPAITDAGRAVIGKWASK